MSVSQFLSFSLPCLPPSRTSHSVAVTLPPSLSLTLSSLTHSLTLSLSLESLSVQQNVRQCTCYNSVRPSGQGRESEGEAVKHARNSSTSSASGSPKSWPTFCRHAGRTISCAAVRVMYFSCSKAFGHRCLGLGCLQERCPPSFSVGLESIVTIVYTSLVRGRFRADSASHNQVTCQLVLVLIKRHTSRVSHGQFPPLAQLVVM